MINDRLIVAWSSAVSAIWSVDTFPKRPLLGHSRHSILNDCRRQHFIAMIIYHWMIVVLDLLSISLVIGSLVIGILKSTFYITMIFCHRLIVAYYGSSVHQPCNRQPYVNILRHHDLLSLVDCCIFKSTFYITMIFCHRLIVAYGSSVHHPLIWFINAGPFRSSHCY